MKRNKGPYKKDLRNEELDQSQVAEMEALMQQTVPRQALDPKEATTSSELKENHNTSEKKVSSELVEYLESVYDEPLLTITRRAEKLGLSAYKSNHIKNELIMRGLAQTFQINLGKKSGGTVKLMELLEPGYQIIGQLVPQEKRYSNSPEHWFWQKSIAKFYRANGYDAVIEMVVNGKRTDVGVTKEGRLYAIECEISAKNTVNNVVNCLDAGFDRVVMACKNSKTKKLVEEKLGGVLKEGQLSKVKVILLTEFPFVQEIVRNTKA